MMQTNKNKSVYPANNLFKEVIIEDENEENNRNPSSANQYSRLSAGNQNAGPPH